MIISFAKMLSVQFISFSYKITTICSDPACLKLQVVFFLAPQDTPYQPLFPIIRKGNPNGFI